MSEPKEPDCPAGRKPHRERVAEINKILPKGKTAGICIDNTPEHRAWYLHELTKYQSLKVVYQGPLRMDNIPDDMVYLIKVEKV